MRTAISLLIASVFVANTAFAEPPPGKGGGSKQQDAGWAERRGKGRESADTGRADIGKGRSDSESGRREGRRSATVSRHFDDHHRSIVREYYVAEYRSGRCPPGLAKKNNGCMPPGQAKKWRVGQPLPPERVFYDVPPELVVRIGIPPPGYRYVRVATDILLIAVGTGMVIDAIADLGKM
jgi:Ni/Co efflux regulator RcnB